MDSEVYEASRCRRVVFLCIAKKTGGPECIYQACSILAKNGYDAAVMHIDASQSVIPGLEKYNVKIVTSILDSEDTLVVIPEGIALGVLDQIVKSKRALWWLSVNTFMLVNDPDLSKMHLVDLLKSKKIDCNFIQSFYAESFCKSMGVQNIRPLKDPISDEFFAPASKCKRADLVLYNPAKEQSVTQLVASSMPHLKFMPLTGFSTEQMASIMDIAKVYLDLGWHPGRDRIPREACLRDLVVITSREGSAWNDVDVAIPSKWKIEYGFFNILEICKKVQLGIDTYDKALKDFLPWKKTIKEERDSFESQVLASFEDLLEKPQP